MLYSFAAVLLWALITIATIHMVVKNMITTVVVTDA